MCDSIAVVSGAGRTLFAKSSDRDPNEAQLLEWVPARRHAPGARLRCTWIEIPQVAETRAVLLSRPFWMWGAEMGANEDGVVIGNEAVFTTAKLPERGLTGMDLLRLALERASSRGEAADVIAELLERHGQGGGCGYEDLGFRYSSSFLIADAGGAVVLETAGRAWRREEITAPGSAREEAASAGRNRKTVVRTISNRLSIAPLRRRAGEPLKPLVARARRRQRITGRCARDAAGPADLFAALRHHGGPRPRYSRLNGAMAAPCMHAGGLVAGSQTVGSWVAELGPDGARHWVTATAAPCLSMFKPVRIAEPLELGPRPSGRADEASLWWRFERLHRRALADLSAPALLRALAERDRIEAGWVREVPEPAAAFERFERWLDSSIAELEAAPARDRRPRWLRRYWQRRAALAELAP